VSDLTFFGAWQNGAKSRVSHLSMISQRCDTLCTSGFPDDVTFSTGPMGQNQARRYMFRKSSPGGDTIPVGWQTVFGWVRQNAATGRSLPSTIALFGSCNHSSRRFIWLSHGGLDRQYLDLHGWATTAPGVSTDFVNDSEFLSLTTTSVAAGVLLLMWANLFTILPVQTVPTASPAHGTTVDFTSGPVEWA